MMKEILVSIIVCCYNQEKYIKKTLDSILFQEHTYPYEIIVCDDSSNDSTPNIITTYSKKYRVIIPVLREKNLGIVKNFYDAVSRCRGKYLMICGGDDYYLPGKISKHIDYLENHQEIGLIHSDVQLISEEGYFKRIKDSSEHYSVDHLLCNYNINAPTMTIKKCDFEEYIKEIKPTEKNWLMEDFPISLWFKIKHKMKYFPGVYVAYRIVDNSISHQVLEDGKFKFEKSCFEVTKFFHCKYPKCITLNSIIRRHLDIVLTLKNYEKFKEYSNEIFLSYENYINGINWIILKNRIHSKYFNTFVIFVKTNIRRFLIIKQEFIRAIR